MGIMCTITGPARTGEGRLVIDQRLIELPTALEMLAQLTLDAGANIKVVIEELGNSLIRIWFEFYVSPFETPYPPNFPFPCYDFEYTFELDPDDPLNTFELFLGLAAAVTFRWVSFDRGLVKPAAATALEVTVA